MGLSSQVIEMFALRIFCILCVIVSPTLAECPGGWWRAGDFCYTTSQQRMNWHTAQELCWIEGGYLAEIKTSEQEKQIESVIRQESHYWIGLNDIATEGLFRWAESHAVAEYTNWYPGEPNNSAGGSTENCVVKGMQGGFAWNDVPCDTDDDTGGQNGGIYALCMMEYSL